MPVLPVPQWLTALESFHEPAPASEAPRVAASVPASAPAPLNLQTPRAPSQSARTGLRAALFEAVKPTHERVATHAFFKGIKDKTLAPSTLAIYLADQNHVLDVLETSLLMRADDAAVRPMIDLRVLNRSGLAAADAAALGFACLPTPTPAACRLAAHIGALAAQDDGAAMSVHAWVQYNAMLNGGQQMAYALRKQFPQTQMALFDFAPGAKHLRKNYGEAINGIAFDEARTAQLCEEAVHAFGENAAMLDDAVRRPQSDVGALY